MKKLINRPEDVVTEALAGMQALHPELIRVDYETRAAVASAVATELCRAIVHQVRKADIILVSDYDKGVCTAHILARVASKWLTHKERLREKALQLACSFNRAAIIL